jgi:FkbM family methyltransferase
MSENTQRIRLADAEFLAEAHVAGLLGTDEDAIRRYWKVGPDDVCLDIGFGPGTWTLVALAKGARTISFDPKPEAVRILMNQVMLNGFTRAVVLPFGLWEFSGDIPFGVNSFKEDNMKDRRRVVRLDDVMAWLRPPHLDFVNMDAEWAEREIVRGARATISGYRPTLIIELHDEAYRAEIIKDITACGGEYVFERDKGFLIAAPKGRIGYVGLIP